MEKSGALNYTLVKSAYRRNPECQFWIGLNSFAVTHTNSTELCTLLALENNFQATGLENVSRKDLDEGQEKQKIMIFII